MNIFWLLLKRKKSFSVLVILLIVLAVAFSSISYCSYVNAQNQYKNMSSYYTTLAISAPANYDEITRLGMIGWKPSDDGNTHWVDGTITYSKENIEKVVLNAPQLEKVEQGGLLSAALPDLQGISSGLLEPKNHADAFDWFRYNFCVLALKCKKITDTAVHPEFYKDDSEMNYYVEGQEKYIAEFEVIGCVSLMDSYGDIVGRSVTLLSYFGSGSVPFSNSDKTIPFEEGKQYLVRGFYGGLFTDGGYDYENERWGTVLRPDEKVYRYLVLTDDAFGDDINFTEIKHTEEIKLDNGHIVNNIYYTVDDNALPFIAEYTGDWQDFLNTDEGKVWKDTIIPLTELNQNSVGVILTNNLNSIYNFNSGIASILEGRAFSDEEYENGSDVCIISASLALRNNLSVGDKISLDYYNTGATKRDLLIPDLNYRSDYYYTRLTLTPENRLGIERECEIIGIYTSPEFTDGQYNFTADNIFVPKKSIPDAEQYENPDIAYLNAFVIKNGMKDDFEAYMAEHDMGESFIYVDMNYADALPALEALSANALRMLSIGCAIFVFVAIIGFYLICRQMKYSIRSVRLIGVEASVVRKQLFSALIGLSAIAALLGAALGAALFKTITAAVLKGSVEFSFGALALCCGVEFAFLLIISATCSTSSANPNLMSTRKNFKKVVTF